MERHLATAAVLLIAAFFALASALGVVRSKNNFAALHALGVLNVLVPPLALVAVIVATGIGMSTLKMFVLVVIVVLGAPVGSHAIAIAEHRRKPR